MKITDEIKRRAKELKQFGKTAKEISQILNISQSTIYNICNEYELQRVKFRICKNCNLSFRGANTFCNKKCWLSFRNKDDTLDIKYFEHIDSAEKAYWLGFLFADGHIFDSKNRSKWCDFVLAVKDEERIDAFIQATKCTPSNKYYRLNGKSFQVGVRIYNQEFVDTLIKQGCTPRKKKTILFPSLDEKYKLPFILGYIDGDGCYFESGNKKHLAITSGSLKFLEQIRSILGITGSISCDNRGNVCYTLYVNVAVHKKIYESYTASMPRKRPKVIL